MGEYYIYYIRKGFTLVELMIVGSIITVLLTIAIPSANKLRIDTKARVCKANLRQMESAIDQWSFEQDVDEGVSLTPYKDDFYAYLRGGEPTCPSGGTYLFSYLGDSPQVICSSGIIGHEYP